MTESALQKARGEVEYSLSRLMFTLNDLQKIGDRTRPSPTFQYLKVLSSGKYLR